MTPCSLTRGYQQSRIIQGKFANTGPLKVCARTGIYGQQKVRHIVSKFKNEMLHAVSAERVHTAYGLFKQKTLHSDQYKNTYSYTEPPYSLKGQSCYTLLPLCVFVACYTKTFTSDKNLTVTGQQRGNL